MAVTLPREPSTTERSPGSAAPRVAGHTGEARSFSRLYLRSELRRRRGAALVIATGLGIGVGFVVTVSSASAGLRRAQAELLGSLYGVGTSLTVSAPPGRRSGTQAPGATNRLSTGESGVLAGSLATAIGRLQGVSAAAGGLTLSGVTLSPAPAGGLPVPTTLHVDGIDVARPRLGPLGAGTLVAGRLLAVSDAASKVAVADAGFAAQKGLRVGSKVAIAGATCTVIGIARQRQDGTAADFYIPLALAQALAGGSTGSHHEVDVIYVQADNAGAVPRVEREISHLASKAAITSAAGLAGEVSGSLSSAVSLIDTLGRWLQVIALVATLAIASLLSMSSVTRRGSELGTLKALGWPSRRVVGQLLAESGVTGAAGAVFGVALAAAATALIDALGPRLSAHSATRSISGAVRLHTHLGAAAAALAVVLAVGGALIAGAAAGWKAVQLPPAAAFAGAV